jgi:hypothetical protein
MPLLEDRTKELFGYSLSSITPGMYKKVAALCDTPDCGTEFTIYRKNMGPLCLCKACKFKAVPRDNYAKGVEKRKKTNLIKFGQENPPRTAEWEANRQAALRDKYGGNSSLSDPTILAKVSKTNQERYGVPWAVAIRSPGKPAVHNGVSTGAAENEICTFVKSIAVDVEQHYKLPGKNLEIDCFVPSLKVGIEYCGLYYHSVRTEEQNPAIHAKHRIKHDAAANQGIRLITLFEDEWLQRRNQTKAALKEILEAPTHVIGGVLCTTREIDIDDADRFVEAYALRTENTSPTRALGIFILDDLLGVVTLTNDPEDARVVEVRGPYFKNDVHVENGTGLLLEAIKIYSRLNGITTLLARTDNRWTSGKDYETAGFRCEHETLFDYANVDFSLPARKRNRQDKTIVQGYSTTSSKGSWKYKQGIWRVWDCGNKHWRMNL